MVDLILLSQIVGRDYLQFFLLAQDAIAKSRELLRETDMILEETYKVLDPGRTPATIKPKRVERCSASGTCKDRRLFPDRN